MREPRIRNDIERATIGGFALPLGLVPGRVGTPAQGYTLDYTPADGDEPDTYCFHVVLSAERTPEVFDRLLDLLPRREVFGIVEIGSRDAYRPVDIYMAYRGITLADYRAAFADLGPFLFEDGSVAVGAMSEEPYLEIFLDQWKGIAVHAPLSMRNDVEEVLEACGLEEVAETWPRMSDEAAMAALRPRPILAIEDEFSADVDEVLLQLRHGLCLDLNVDRDTNVDDSGRSLGPTLWHAMVIVESADDPDSGAYASIWATASSLREIEHLIERTIDDRPEWRFSDVYALDRVAYDDRPDELIDLPLRRTPGVHQVDFDRWPAPYEDGERGDRPEWPVRPVRNTESGERGGGDHGKRDDAGTDHGVRSDEAGA